MQLNFVSQVLARRWSMLYIFTQCNLQIVWGPPPWSCFEPSLSRNWIPPHLLTLFSPPSSSSSKQKQSNVYKHKNWLPSPCHRISSVLQGLLLRFSVQVLIKRLAKNLHVLQGLLLRFSVQALQSKIWCSGGADCSHLWQLCAQDQLQVLLLWLLSACDSRPH